jgi:hypothetical protein
MKPDIVMAGAKTTFVIRVNTTGADGNATGKPAKSGLHVRIINSTGDDVTTTIGSLSHADMDGNPFKNITNEYIQKPNIYTVYAYNNTHSSEGRNGTLEVRAVNVESTLKEYIWKYDDNVTDTFLVTYNGEPTNGTLRVDNITDNTTYNRTWIITNFSYTLGGTGGTDQSETSRQLTVTDGTVTMHNITANFLPGVVRQRNVTFYFKPKTPSGSAWAPCTGFIPVKIPDVTPTPKALVYNAPAELEVLVTGRGTGLSDLLVNISVPGLTGEMNTRTISGGTALFAFTPPTTGYIRIEIENRTSATRVQVTAWKLYLDVDTQVDEGSSFTVTVTNGTATGAPLEGASVIFNRVTETTDSAGQFTFTAPAITATKDFTVVARLSGYADDTETITVNNVPKLLITITAKADKNGKYTSPLTVTISDDTGQLITGAIVTFSGDTYTTVAGQVDIEVTEETSGTITATLTGFQDADAMTITIKTGGIPGFELLTLLVALGVAFILLRRRRH